MKSIFIWFSLISLACLAGSGTSSELTLPLVACVIVVDDILYYLLYLVITLIVTWLMTDAGGTSSSTQADEFSAPELTASDPIPVLFGTQFIKNMNVVWYGNVVSTPWEKCS